MDDRILFILGAGASFDSGIPTFRGVGSDKNKNHEKILIPQNLETQKGRQNMWEFLLSLFEKISNAKPGPTYIKLKEFVEKYPKSFIVTQNVDGLVNFVSKENVEIHGNFKTMKCDECNIILPFCLENQKCKCGLYCRSCIVLYSERLSFNKTMCVDKFLKKKPKYVVVIGTTLQFPYLMKWISKAKRNQAKIIHINPDPTYSVLSNEIWFCENACCGLVSLEKYIA